MTALLSGLLAILALVLIAIFRNVMLRAAAGRGQGVRVYDLGCDVDLPARLSARSYQIALYLTMKSRAAEPLDRPVSGPASSP